MVKENKGLRGDVLQYVAQGTQQFDAEIAEKGHLRMETNYFNCIGAQTIIQFLTDPAMNVSNNFTR